LNIFGNSIEKIQISLNSNTYNGYFTWDLCTFMIVHRWTILRTRNISDKSCRQNQNIFYVQQIFTKIVPRAR